VTHRPGNELPERATFRRGSSSAPSFGAGRPKRRSGLRESWEGSFGSHTASAKCSAQPGPGPKAVADLIRPSPGSLCVPFHCCDKSGPPLRPVIVIGSSPARSAPKRASAVAFQSVHTRVGGCLSIGAAVVERRRRNCGDECAWVRRKRAPGVDEADRSDIAQVTLRKMPPRYWPASMSRRLARSRVKGSPVRPHGDCYGLDGSGIRLGSAPAVAGLTYATFARGTDCRTRNWRRVMGRITRKYPTRSARKMIAMWRGRARSLERPRPMRRREIQPFRTR
jgi:hypothetical protein